MKGRPLFFMGVTNRYSMGYRDCGAGSGHQREYYMDALM